MDEATLKNIVSNFKGGMIDVNNVKLLLESYIYDRKNVKIDINTNVILFSNQNLVMNMCDYAIDWYSQKFNISYMIKN